MKEVQTYHNNKHSCNTPLLTIAGIQIIPMKVCEEGGGEKMTSIQFLVQAKPTESPAQVQQSHSGVSCSPTS